MVERARAFLARHSIESARLEAELLVAHALGLDRLKLFLTLEREVDREEIARARELLVARSRGEPCAYLTGKKEFYGREFRVGPSVLIPRPETELLVDRVRALAAGRSNPRIAELGTGSGCIAVTLALELDGSEVVASDLSQRALEVARENARHLGARLELRSGDGLAPLRDAAGYDFLVSNPPYVEPSAELAPEVRREPPEALFPPDGDPDHWVRVLLAEGPALLRAGGFLVVELGLGQAARVRELLAGRQLRAGFPKDLAGIERVLEVGPI